MVDAIVYVTLIEYILTLICASLATYYFGAILYWSMFKKLSLGMNTSMILYVWMEFLFSFTTTIYALCFSIYWRAEENIYNAYVIFFTGGTVTIFLVTEPLFACYLGIERCLCLMLPFKDTKFWSKIITALTILSGIIFVALIMPLHVMTGWPSSPITNCRSFGCMQSSSGQIYNTLRYITAIGSVFIGITLIRLFQTKTNKNFNIKNTRLVVITLIAAILFDFFPHLISFCLSAFAGISLTKLIGPYSTLVSAINSFICGLAYYKAMKSSLKLVNVKTSAASNTNTNTPNIFLNTYR